MLKIRELIIISILAIFIAGCSGENNSDVPQGDDPEAIVSATLVLVENSSTVTTNDAIIEIDVTVIDTLNNPYNDGNVTIVYPDDIREGRDVGIFSASTVSVNNGHANFEYTVPKDLTTNTSDIVFGFYHSDNPSNIVEYTIKIVAAQTPSISTTYTLNINSSDDDFFIPLENSELFSFFLTDDKNSLLEDDDVISLRVEILNPNLGTLIDSEGNRGNTLKIDAKNTVSMKVEAKTVSGVIPLQVDASFKNASDETETISKIFNIIVLSGPPSAISLSYAGTSLEKQDYAKFVEKWVLTVTDRYNNLVNTNPYVSMGMLAGYAQDSSNTASNSSNYLYFKPSEGNGRLSNITDSFTTASEVFDQVDQTNQYLVTFGNGYTYNASGKWSINTNSATQLDLVEEYTGATTSGLGFAVGNNFRQDKSDEGVEWIGNVYPEAEGNYSIPSSGSMRINVEYDYYLTGKDVILWVNLLGKNYKDDSTVRIGEARKITLVANGITPNVESQVVEIGASNKPFIFQMHINDTARWYRHANFGVDVETSDKVSIDSIEYSDIEDNYAYIIVNVTNNDPEATGSVSLTNALVGKEF